MIVQTHGEWLSENLSFDITGIYCLYLSAYSGGQDLEQFMPVVTTRIAYDHHPNPHKIAIGQCQGNSRRIISTIF